MLLGLEKRFNVRVIQLKRDYGCYNINLTTYVLTPVNFLVIIVFQRGKFQLLNLICASDRDVVMLHASYPFQTAGPGFLKRRKFFTFSGQLNATSPGAAIVGDFGSYPSGNLMVGPGVPIVQLVGRVSSLVVRYTYRLPVPKCPHARMNGRSAFY